MNSSTDQWERSRLFNDHLVLAEFYFYINKAPPLIALWRLSTSHRISETWVCPVLRFTVSLTFHAFLPSAYEQPYLAVESCQMYVSLKWGHTRLGKFLIQNNHCQQKEGKRQRESHLATRLSAASTSQGTSRVSDNQKTQELTRENTSLEFQENTLFCGTLEFQFLL